MVGLSLFAATVRQWSRFVVTSRDSHGAGAAQALTPNARKTFVAIDLLAHNHSLVSRAIAHSSLVRYASIGSSSGSNGRTSPTAGRGGRPYAGAP